MTAAASFMLTWVAYLAMAAVGYAGALLGIDALLQAQAARRRHRAELIRISEEAALAVHRINGAFLVARQLIRDEAKVRPGSHR